MIYVISDLHGYPLERFLQLLEKASFGKDDFLYILGDVVDRNGDGGVEMLQWLMYQTNVELIMGNHEAMLLSNAFVFDEMTEESLDSLTEEMRYRLSAYYLDGGKVTLDAMHKISKDTQQDILYYLRDCPLYEMIDVGGKTYFLVHSGIEEFDRNKKLNEYRDDQFLWARPDFDTRYFDDVMTILGHTPVIAFGKEYKDTIIKTDTWMDIDMGAGFGEEPVLLRLDDMKEFRLK